MVYLDQEELCQALHHMHEVLSKTKYDFFENIRKIRRNLKRDTMKIFHVFHWHTDNHIQQDGFKVFRNCGK